MDQQNIIFFGCLTLALAISAFILWGPSPRPRKKKGQIVGLVNLGSTCFLNTLLQALASCAIFLHWLTQQKHEENTLTSSLHDVLWVLNHEGVSDVHAPVEVLSALKRHGWMVPSGEQDAHELFHVIVSTLQEENKKLAKAASLSDALPLSDTLSQSSDILDDNSDVHLEGNKGTPAHLPETDAGDFEESHCDNVKTKIGQGDNSETKTLQDNGFCGDSSLVFNDIDKVNQGDSCNESSTGVYYSLTPDNEKEPKKYCGDADNSNTNIQADLSKNKEENNYGKKTFVRNASQRMNSQESRRDKSPRIRGCYDRATKGALSAPQADAPPFQGLLTSTLQCSTCGYFSSLHFDTFDSLSLPLGDNFHFQVQKLQDLLRMFVKTEIIPEVECEKCCKKTTALKTMNFGKLPSCLCLHIARTTWQSYSHTPTKRDDFVDFPEYLPMDEYTVSARLKSSSTSSLQTLNSDSPILQEKSYKHIYRLKSVVVHLGGVSSGHFLTYRRGALDTLKRHRVGKLAGACKDSRRWYLTSDDNVKMSTLCEAMDSLAYMLFYEKCGPDFMPNDEDAAK